ncbi:MAG: right-handed parallel beta-helix repeat-containing protein, partial [Halioglobus sp.]|nr:right-handed parallel beta-helix repeat-containing protein [Halioglobus sp.]
MKTPLSRGAPALVLALLVALPALSANITVNTLAGDNDGACDAGGTGPADDCSLLEAIDLANGDPVADVILFGVSGLITPEVTPTILTPVTLDGTSAPGGTRSVTINRDIPQRGFERGVVVSGAAAGGSVVQGLTFTRRLLGALGDSMGVLVEDAPNVRVGGSTPAQGNQFFSTDFSIQYSGAGASGGVVRGNTITGNNQGAFDYAITIDGTPNASIGGNGANDGNTISTVEFGIFIAEAASSGFSIVGNQLTNITEDGIRLVMGMTSGSVRGNTLTNNSEGIVTESVSGLIIGGLGAGEGNTVTGGNPAIRVGAGSSNLDILGNSISTSGNFGIRVQGNTSSGNEILGNSVSNAVFCIAIDGAPGNVVGGASTGGGNTVSNCDNSGIRMLFSSSSGTRIIGNEITGAGDMGIFIEDALEGAIGGTAPGQGNRISGPDSGIVVRSSSGGAMAHALLGNSIASSTGLGIDLTATFPPPDGVTANDPAPDADVGPNGLQNFPVISAVTPGGNVAFSLVSSPGTTFRVEAFASASQGPGGFGPGERFLNAVQVTTNGAGMASGSVPAAGLTAGEWATLTATSLDASSASGFGGTSEFSRAVRAGGAALPTVTLSLAPGATDENGGVAKLTATLSSAAVGEVVLSLSYAGTAQMNTDFSAPVAITIPDGQTVGTASLVALDNTSSDGDR